MDNLKPPSEMDFISNFTENWRKWRESMKLNLDLCMSGKEDKDKVNLFLNVFGQEGRDIHSTMTIADADRNKIDKLFDSRKIRETSQTETQAQPESDLLFIGAIGKKRTQIKDDECFATLVVEGKDIQFKVDTGAQANVIPTSEFNQLPDTDPTVTPVLSPPRNQPAALRDTLKKTLNDMEQQGVIRNVDQPTEWVNSLVVVEKPQETHKLRVCLDPKPLNKAIKREHFALPTIEEITTRLAGAN
ncbi:hypothetical protein BSL78_06389 [Apostichopus japonicus]|uniref:Peptidase A2 domain-containing protein n=1 Tax=Stichopus japonicus TaxID=307972 RepID=A0A2G8L8S8_STIJA|nr:hypothetical protein BSL78_06389 [Apostichopus japonicus]